MTNCPGLTDRTARPTSSTMPQYSCPIGVGPLIGSSPRYGHRSDPHTHVREIRMMASVGSTILGNSRSSTSSRAGRRGLLLAWFLSLSFMVPNLGHARPLLVADGDVGDGHRRRGIALFCI